MRQRNIFKRLSILLLMAVMATATALAQDDLKTGKAFEQYGHAKGCKMVELHDTRLKGYKLKVYKSLTYKKYGENIATLLKEDRKRARKIREVVENGRIVSGYYMMPAEEKNINRYILFSNTDSNRGAVIYIEGNLSPQDIMSICYAK